MIKAIIAGIRAARPPDSFSLYPPLWVALLLNVEARPECKHYTQTLFSTLHTLRPDVCQSNAQTSP